MVRYRMSHAWRTAIKGLCESTIQINCCKDVARVAYNANVVASVDRRSWLRVVDLYQRALCGVVVG